jgi:hypothetical protein
MSGGGSGNGIGSRHGSGSGSGGGGALAATVDGAALPEEEARALWTEFSRYMDEHKGDTAGFARLHGWASVAPAYQGGRAVLAAWTKEPPPAAPKKQGRPRRGGRGSRGRRG